jgi:alpha-1,6-mannosyltransferase
MIYSIKTQFYFYLLALISLGVYFELAYFLERQHFFKLIVLFGIAFGVYILMLKSKFSVQKLFYFGLTARLVFMFSIPFLSQDFYRFIWDGNLILCKINPFEFLPNDLIYNQITFANKEFLFRKMGDLSASHYSNYPPLNQFLFAIATYFGQSSIVLTVIVMRLMLIGADVGIYYFGKKILNHFKLPETNIFFYFLNPLVIVELTANLHFESVMLFFWVLCFYFLIQNKTWLAALFIAFSISVKLLPLLALPLFYQFFGYKKSVLFYFLVLLINILLFLPFINSDLLRHYLETIGLWFTNFEFNASCYYVVRELGFYYKGYNIIKTVGNLIPWVSLMFLWYFSFFRKNISVQHLIQNSLIFFTIYFFISTTVHPWYVVNLTLLAAFTNFKYAYLWSGLVVLSYFTYSNPSFKENYDLLILEYLPVYLYFGYELYKKEHHFKLK